MTNLKFSHYLGSLIDARKNIWTTLDDIESEFLSPIYMEVSVEKNYMNKLTGKIEYSAGYPHRNIAIYCIKNAEKQFRNKLLNYLENNTLSMNFHIISRIKDRITQNYFQLINNVIPGGIIINGRKVNKQRLRKNKLSNPAGFSWQMPAGADINDAVTFNKLPLPLAPAEVRKEIAWHLSARAGLFQRLLSICNRMHEKLIISIKQKNPNLYYKGKFTDLITLIIAIHGSANIVNRENEQIDIKSLVTGLLNFLNVKPENLNDLLQQIIDTDTTKRERRIHRWVSTGMCTLISG